LSCSGSLATSFDFGVFWCLEELLAGVDDSAGGPAATVTENDRDFTTLGLAPGMPVYNATKGTYGKVTTIAAHTLGTTTAWWASDVYNVLPMPPDQVATIERYLAIASGDIHAARAASGGCACTLASWAAEHLRKLCVVEAAVFHNCPCGNARLSDAMKQTYLRWVTDELANIRMGKIELCEGETGSEFPAVGWIEMGWSPWSQGQIVMNRIARFGA